MKKRYKLLGFVAILAALGLLFSSCDTGAGNITPDISQPSTPSDPADPADPQDLAPSPTNVTVTFDANGGDPDSVPSPMLKPQGYVIEFWDWFGLVPDPIKPHHTFSGWHYDPLLHYMEDPLEYFTVGNVDQTIYAIWTPNLYRITFDANGANVASLPAAMNRAFSTLLTLADISPPTRTGYEFVGWNTNQNATERLTSISVTGDKTLFAIWLSLVSNITVTLNTSGAPGLAPIEKESGAVTPLPVHNWNDGGFWRVFRGWATSSAATVPAHLPGAAFSSDDDVTLYAVWSEYGFAFDGGAVTGFRGETRDIVIPSVINNLPVTSIGNEAFRLPYIGLGGMPPAYYGLNSVVIPGSVVTIGVAAFRTNNLTSVEIQEGVTTISNYAFWNNMLETVVLPSSVRTIGANAFRGQSLFVGGIMQHRTLTSVYIPEGVATITGPHAFAQNDLREVVIPSTLASLPNNTFSTNLNMHTLYAPGLAAPGPVTPVVGNSAFHGNPLTRITVGEGALHQGTIVAANNRQDFGTNTNFILTRFNLGNPAGTFVLDGGTWRQE